MFSSRREEEEKEEEEEEEEEEEGGRKNFRKAFLLGSETPEIRELRGGGEGWMVWCQVREGPLGQMWPSPLPSVSSCGRRNPRKRGGRDWRGWDGERRRKREGIRDIGKLGRKKDWLLFFFLEEEEEEKSFCLSFFLSKKSPFRMN